MKNRIYADKKIIMTNEAFYNLVKENRKLPLQQFNTYSNIVNNLVRDKLSIDNFVCVCLGNNFGEVIVHVLPDEIKRNGNTYHSYLDERGDMYIVIGDTLKV